jgi:rhodanese-related sulfurtransferase
MKAEELKMVIQNEEITLIDIRSAKEFAKAHLPKAINLDFYQEDFEEKFKALLLKDKVVLYCNHGERKQLSAYFFSLYL